MAKRQQSPVVVAPTVHVEDNGFVLELDAAILRDLTPQDVTASGMLLVNVQQKLSLICTDEKGPRPVNFSLSIYIKRDAITDKEAFDVADAKTKSKAEKDAKTLAAAQQHMADIKAAETKTREMLREGQALAHADLASSIKTVGAVIPVLQSLGNMAVAAGLNKATDSPAS